MSKHKNTKIGKTIVCLSLAVLLFGTIAFTFQTDEELKKKYAPIIGSYEYDMTQFEMGVMTVNVYVEYGALWAFPDSSDSPGEMIAVEGKEFEFNIDDGEGGTWGIKFIKDDTGEYSKCHATNEFQVMDVIGTKIK